MSKNCCETLKQAVLFRQFGMFVIKCHYLSKDYMKPVFMSDKRKPEVMEKRTQMMRHSVIWVQGR